MRSTGPITYFIIQKLPAGTELWKRLLKAQMPHQVGGRYAVRRGCYLSRCKPKAILWYCVPIRWITWVGNQGMEGTAQLSIITKDVSGDFVLPILTTFDPVVLQVPCSHKGGGVSNRGYIRTPIKLIAMAAIWSRKAPCVSRLAGTQRSSHTVRHSWCYHYEEVSPIQKGSGRNIFGSQVIY